MLETSPALFFEPFAISDVEVFAMCSLGTLIFTGCALRMKRIGNTWRCLILHVFASISLFFMFFNCTEPYEKDNRMFTVFLMLSQVFNMKGRISLVFYALRIACNVVMFIVNMRLCTVSNEKLAVILTLGSAFLMFYMNSSPSFWHKVLLIVVNATTVLELVSFCFLDSRNAIYAILVELNCCVFSFNDRRKILALEWLYTLLFSSTCILRAIMQYILPNM